MAASDDPLSALWRRRSGQLQIQLEREDDVSLGPGQFYVVPRGVRHNPVAEKEARVVLIETVTTAHTGDVTRSGTVPIDQQWALSYLQ